MKILKGKFVKTDIANIDSQELATDMCISVAMNDVNKISLYV